MGRLISLLVVIAVVLAACGGVEADDGSESPDLGSAPTTQAPETGGDTPLADDDGETTSGMGPGISVADLLASSLDGPVLVTGYVFVGTDGRAVISDAIAESYPPQPAGAQIRIDGVDLMQLPLVEGPVDSEIPVSSWTEQPVQLLGDVVDGVFVGATGATG